MADNYQELIREHVRLPYSVAWTLARKYPASVDVEDMRSAGIIGLIEAAMKYDTGRGIDFRPFAIFRIRGSILDELRSLSFIPRTVLDRRKSAKVMREKLGRDAVLSGRSIYDVTDFDVAEALGVEIGKGNYLDYFAEATIFSLDHGVDFEEGTFESNLEDASQIYFGTLEGTRRPIEDYLYVSYVFDCIDHLPRRDRQCFYDYYLRDLEMKDIGTSLGISESRVSQILSRSLTGILQK